MSDYIKREDAIFIALQQPIYSVVSQIKQLNGINIVRCKECRHADKCSQNIAMLNTYEMYEQIDFCSYGEREGE